MPKFLFAASAIVALLVWQPTYAQHPLLLLPAGKVDSTFTANLTKISEQLRIGQHLTSDQISFVYVLGFLSGLSFDLQSYSGYPNLTHRDVKRFANWYAAHKTQIEWPRLQRGLTLLAAPLTNENVAELEALKIK